MRIQTLSILAGSEACNARCPYCISRMTPAHGVALAEPTVVWRNFAKACRLAQLAGATTAMLTGKGEPTLFPAQLARFLEALAPYDFPLVEIQTNGLVLAGDGGDALLERWAGLGLSTVAVSIAHFDPERNREIYVPQGRHFDLAALVARLHRHGISARLSCTLARGFIEDGAAVRRLVDFARAAGAEQLTLTPVAAPAHARDAAVAAWAAAHALDAEEVAAIKAGLDRDARPVLELAHGAVVYDLDGQNVCLSNCLRPDRSLEEIRNLIFFPDGHLRHSWDLGGAILL